MEFLKEIFGTDALTMEQFTEKLAGNEAIKLANIAMGDYVGKGKFKALEIERDGLKEQLETARVTINDFEKLDIEGIRAASEKYKEDAATAQQNAEAKVAAAEYRTAAIEAASGLSFTSNSAKNAYISALVAKQLPLDGGKLTGLTDFQAAYKEDDPEAFKSQDDKPVPTITIPGTTKSDTPIDKEKMGYLERLKIKQTEPQKYNTLFGKGD